MGILVELALYNYYLLKNLRIKPIHSALCPVQKP